MVVLIRTSLLLSSLALIKGVEGWVATSLAKQRFPTICTVGRSSKTVIGASDDKSVPDDEEFVVERASFDQAGQSLIEAEDQKRLEQMGDFDANEDYQGDSVERMRAAIRERAAGLGVEKSKVSAEYIKMKQQAAQTAGPGGQADANMFGGLDLSQISDTKQDTQSEWNEQMPAMFYDSKRDLSQEEQEEADPIMTKPLLERYLYEIQESKWPSPTEVLTSVGVMFIVIGFTTAVVLVLDRVLREFYSGVGFVPTKEDLANYAARFDGLDLPDGWLDNMEEGDVQMYSETVKTGASSALPPAAPSSTLPDL